MTCEKVTVFIILLAITAAVKLDAAHPPHHHSHHHHDAIPVHVKPGVSSSNLPSEEPSPVQEETIEDNQKGLESLQEEDVIEDEPQNEVESLQEEDVNEDESDVFVTGLREFSERKSIPTKCDALALPKYSCYNCYSYLVCKPEGGKIKACSDPYAPYCNNGICSQTPSDTCSNL